MCNRATDIIELWLNNDEGLYSYWVERASELDCQELADELKEELRDNHPLVDDASMYSDIMSWALAGVDWQAVAAGFLEESLE